MSYLKTAMSHLKTAMSHLKTAMSVQATLNMLKASIILSVLWLGGCAQQAIDANTQYYLLSSNTESYSKNTVTKTVGVIPVTVATYINTPGIALQTRDNHIRIANQHLWAEQPELSLTRVLHSELDFQLTNMRVDNGALGRQTQWDYALATQIDQFHGIEDGFAVFSGFWQLKRGDAVLKSERFNYKQSIKAPGYGPLVTELRAMLSTLAKAQASAIKAL